MEKDFLELGAVFILAISLVELLKFTINKFTKKNEKNSDENIGTQLLLMNNKLDNHITHISEKITIIKEDIREIKGEILNIKLNKN